LLAALMTASFIQSIFKFRPLVYVTGDTSTGKSDLQKYLMKSLFGKLANRQQKPSESGFRQSIAHNSHVCLIDELEKSKHREEILKLLRAATDGDPVTRGTTHHKAIMFHIKHIVWISSIELNLAQKADANRFFQFETLAPQNSNGKRSVLKINERAVSKIGFELLVFTIKNMNTLLQSTQILSEANIDDAMPRNIDIASVPAAFAELLCGWTREETLDFMYNIIHRHSAQKLTDVTNEHDDLLQTILSQIIYVTNYGDLSIMQTIRKIVAANKDYDANEMYAREALERHGIKLIKTIWENSEG
jgi:Cdc6-like AAA superfamily ATPase